MNHDGSLKGMEARATLECVQKVWSHGEIKAYIDIICIDDDATTKAYLQHSFADLDANQMPCLTNKKGVPKTSKKDDNVFRARKFGTPVKSLLPVIFCHNFYGGIFSCYGN
jgi:hypothetical protein